jgi:penicillin-binding protein 1A
MALGAGSVTPMQLATGYSVFANGGYRVNPWLITRVSDQKGKVLLEVTPPEIGEGARAIDARNAFVMSSLLQEITRSGTAARAQGTLKRPDLYGKTGTTNDSMDAWFAGFQPSVTAVAWMGYSNPRKLGDRETGGGLSLPIWINYMSHALKSVPVQEIPPTEGVVSSGGEWFYEEFARGGGITSLGLEDPAAVPEGAASAPTASEERRGILDMFRN